MSRTSHSVAAPECGGAPCSSCERQTPLLDETTEQVRLEINADRLRHLLKMGALCAADFRCLDCESTQCVWRICLMNCIKHFVERPSGLCNRNK